MSNSSFSWWAQSKSRSQATTAAFLVLATVLGGISYFVWSSPGSQVRQAVTAAVDVVNPMAAQNATLKEALGSASTTIASQKIELKKLQSKVVAAQAATAKKLAQAQQRTLVAENALAAAKAQVRAATAVGTAAGTTGAAGTGAGSSGGGTGGSGGTGSGGSGGTGGTGSQPAPITAPSKAALLQPANRYFGMYTEQAPFNWATFDATSAKIGVTPNVVGYFSGWDETFRANAVTRAWQQGRLPMMTWESRPISAGNDTVDAPEYSLPKIIGGSFDAYLHQYAKDIVATGLPLAIRLDHEMNSNWYPWVETDGKGNSVNGNNVGDYVKMWRHVHDIFQSEGANSLVMWVWSPNIVNNLPATHKADGYLAGLYPGDQYVDWVGLSGYLRPPYKADNDYTFDYTYGESLKELRAIAKKPIMLSEIGASETGGHKAAWISSFFDGLSKPENSDIVGFSWFNLAVTSYVEGVRATNDWRIDSRADSLSAFIEGLTRPEDHFTLTPAK
ncbi:glycoside hydrolase family 26 protein [Leifsonia poae]|uniref:GH26 domain-containing protein n=1 Tax=Leifsonia poae TaxID=110933 RepID=A0A9W6H829_9MICO|nr:glycosyl hydrolase [Leifsonia poae]GLJ75174.1 hypothetical protein GCM10017584_07470 [Leifsonia poae]